MINRLMLSAALLISAVSTNLYAIGEGEGPVANVIKHEHKHRHEAEHLHMGELKHKHEHEHHHHHHGDKEGLLSRR